MFRGLLDFINVMMMWGFAYLVAFIILIMMLADLPTDSQPIIHEHTTIQVVEATHTRDVCNRIDGCPIVNNVCVGCVVK